jgi:hypothetical protein
VILFSSIHNNLYTKVVLTVIAITLLWVGSAIHPATVAAQGPVKDILTGVESENVVVPVQITGIPVVAVAK